MASAGDNVDEDEEEDYMSDKFLQGICDVTPGLQKSRHKETKKVEVQRPPTKRKASELQKEKLEEGLTKRLNSDNKGFNMLLKMGYKPGMGLGKSENGRSDPVPLEIMGHRQGLGHAAEQRRKLEEREKMLKNTRRANDERRLDFRAEMSARFRRGAVIRKLSSAQRLCHSLDTEIFGFEKPLFPGYWPLSARNEEEEGEDAEEEEDEDSERDQDPEESLIRVCDYLRSAHWYCFWCGAKFKDDEELMSKCPGASEEDHG